MESEVGFDPKLLVFGSTSFDNLTTPMDRQQVAGGAGYYSACAASFFTKVKFLSNIGLDFPSQYVGLIERLGVDVSDVSFGGNCARFHITYEDFQDANYDFIDFGVCKEPVVIPESAKQIKNVHFATLNSDILLDSIDVLGKRKIYSMDSHSSVFKLFPDQFVESISRVKVLFLNHEEARMISCRNNVSDTIDELLSVGPEIVVIKQGKHGAVVGSKKFSFKVPTLNALQVVDPTGAGDCFSASFAGYLAQSKKRMTLNSVFEGLMHASAVSALVIQDFGPNKLFSVSRKDISNVMDTASCGVDLDLEKAVANY
ncbi:MAG: hypothetical protein J7K00_04350 [Candidatus Diapherotrites archaeon]|nr:hypothetical protein [Candidatus Diapherotrites archaeon]